MIIFAVLAAALSTLAAAPPQGGVYELESPAGRCQLLLQDTAAPLPETNLSSDDAAGFAMAMPGCPAALSETAFWRFAGGAGELSLFDTGGETLATVRAGSGRGWAGATTQGDALTLTRR